MSDEKMDTMEEVAQPSDKKTPDVSMEEVDQPSDKKTSDKPKETPSNKQIFEEMKYDWKESIEPHLKIAVIGEKGSGKSSLILAAKNRVLPHPDDNFVSKHHFLEIHVDGKEERCMVVEAGNDYEVRKKIYSETDVVLLCFCEQYLLPPKIEKKWTQELKTHIPKVPVFLVKINKTNQKDDDLPRVDSEVLPFAGLVECCPYSGVNTQYVFQLAIQKVRGQEFRTKK